MRKSLHAVVVTSLLACAGSVAGQGEAGHVAGQGEAGHVAGQGEAGHVAGPRIEGGAFFAVRVGDADAAARWYAETLDLSEVNRIDDEGGRFAIRLLAGSGLAVEVIQQVGASAAGEGPTLGLFKVGYTVEDIDAFHALLRRRSVDVDDRIFTDVALGARSFVFRDLDGNRIQVFEPCGEECREGPP